MRDVARTASTPLELPEAHELLAELASVLGLEGAEHGYAGDDPHRGSLGRVITVSTTRRAARIAPAFASLSLGRSRFRTTARYDRSRRPARVAVEHNPPHGRVPVLEEDGWVLPESAVIDEYLEERFP